MPMGWATAAAAVLGYMGQEDTNQTNIERSNTANAASAQQAAQQMDFQERMSNTSYQRGVKDMEAAGLNPMLAYSQGGASSPSGAMGQVTVPQIGNKMAAAGQASQIAMQNQQAQAQIENIKADTGKKEAETETEKNRPENVRSDTELKRTMEGLSKTQQQNVIEQTNLVVSQRHLTDVQAKAAFEGIANIAKTGKEIDARTANYAVDTALSKLRVPMATNAAEAQNSWWMKNVSPYLPDVLKSTTSAGGAARILK